MKRREFIKTSALLAAAAGAGELLKASSLPSDIPSPETELEINPEAEAVPDPWEPEEPADGQLIVSAPMLQNFAATSMGVAFAVSALANGYVLVGEQPNLSDARKVLCGGYRVTDLGDRTWAQIVGGGPTLGYTGSGENRREDPGLFPTVVEGLVRDGRLEILVHNLVTGSVQDRFAFLPRR